jgi:hypothetical protein
MPRPRTTQTLPRIAAAALLALLGGCAGSPAVVGPQVAEGYGYVCAAGVYQCRLPQQVRVGEHCSCPGLGAPSFGYVH